LRNAFPKEALPSLNIEEWWAEPVKEIFKNALASLGGDDEPLKNGPGHIIWADGNFSDQDILFCLEECQSRRQEWTARFGEHALSVVQFALENLLTIKEDIRDCDPYVD
jgi:hypothetical protein